MGGKDVAIATYPSETEAIMWAGVLKSEGIPSMLVPTGAGVSALGQTIFRPFQIRVRAEDVTRARQVLEDFDSAPPSIPGGNS